MNVYLNGSIIAESNANIHVKDRGILLGDGLFETCLAKGEQIQFFSEHYNRLKNSVRFLEIPWNYSHDELLALCTELIAQNNLRECQSALRITLTRGSGLRGLSYPIDPKPTLFITANEYHHPTVHYPRALITQVRRNTYSEIVRHKTLNYLEQILARNEALRKGFDEGIMLNTEGFISECSAANIFFVKDDAILTPHINSGILPGIVRQFVISACKKNRIPIIESDISIDDALSADAAFQTNSLIGIQELASINERIFDCGSSSIIKKLNEFLE